MDRSLECFIHDTSEKEAAGRFERETDRILRIDLDGGVWLKPGAAVAHRGDISFERLRTLDAASITGAALRELSPLVRACGRGRVHCANHGRHVQIVRLAGEALAVSWLHLLAFEESLEFELSLVGNGLTLATGGLVVVKLSGHGAVAFGAHGAPVTLAVTPGQPVCADPNATVAWLGVSPALQTDLTWRSVFAHGGQEPIQMRFDGVGFVVVQAFEDQDRLTLGRKSVESLLSAVAAL